MDLGCAVTFSSETALFRRTRSLAARRLGFSREVMRCPEALSEHAVVHEELRPEDHGSARG